MKDYLKIFTFSLWGFVCIGVKSLNDFRSLLQGSLSHMTLPLTKTELKNKEIFCRLYYNPLNTENSVTNIDTEYYDGPDMTFLYI